MSEGNQIHVFQRMMVIITREEDQKKLDEVFQSMCLPISFQIRGKGTAPSEIMDIFGLCGTTRLLTIGFLPKFRVKPVFEALNHEISFQRKGGGIALTIPLNGLQSHILQLLNEEARNAVEKSIKGDEREMKEKSEFSIVWTSVVSGYSDDVIDAAREAGARGGTVIKGRRRNSDRASKFFGIPLQEEQDFVMIVVPREKKCEVMSAISERCGLRTEAHGVILSLPVDDVMGLEG